MGKHAEALKKLRWQLVDHDVRAEMAALDYAIELVEATEAGVSARKPIATAPSSPGLVANTPPSPPTDVAPPATVKVAKITERMAEVLEDMQKGHAVESEMFFSWPSWKDGKRPSRSHACPSRAMLEGMQERGLLDVKEGKNQYQRIRWTITLNDAGHKALADYKEAKRNRKPTGFKRFEMSYERPNGLGLSRVRSRQTVIARTEKEARSKLARDLGAHGTSAISEVRVEGIYG
jgi:hypothetical protein